MADVTYNTASFPALAQTLASLVRLTEPDPFVLMGYKERDPQERVMWEMAREVGVIFEQVGESQGWGGAPVEIWVGRVTGES
jgi:hypothetical protein